MWGNIVLETVFSGNYTFGFPTNRSSVTLHLTHWQYWFWFWFTWFLGLYYLIFINFFLKRPFKIYPKINTSFRSHGKWGDLLVMVVPVSWCLNILTNSNFILRLVEWQSESSVFNLRVRAKQWYWVYKFDILNIYNIPQTVKQIGHNNWYSFTNNTDTFVYDVFRLQNKFETQKTFWKDTYKLVDTRNGAGFLNSVRLAPTLSNSSLSEDLGFDLNGGVSFSGIFKKNTPNYLYQSTLSSYKVESYINVFSGVQSDSSNTFVTTYDNLDPAHKSSTIKLNYRLEKNKYLLNNVSKNINDLKKNHQNSFLIIKQKRFVYKPQYHVYVAAKKNLNELGTFFGKYSKNLYKHYIYNKRMLRTTKMVVLPTNVNIAVITNSFDVIHSWFIPGLGFKLDCVPGRSTHHTLHILNPGFYYGQCAEVCGRYHHHMPVRICAINYPHFLFWWNNRGLAQFIELKDNPNII